MGYLHYNGSTENDVICHNSDCLQFSVSLTVFPFMFDSVRKDLKLYSWFINKLCSIKVLGSFYASFLLLKRYSSYTPYACLPLLFFSVPVGLVVHGSSILL